MRYFDLKEVAEFIHYVYSNKFGTARTNLDRHFETLDDINMKNIKVYYLTLLQNILPEKWREIFEYFKVLRKPRILENNKVDPKGNKITKIKSIGPGVTMESVNPNSLAGTPLTRLASEQFTHAKSEEPKGTSGVYVSTKDAYTLTDGPTIFISDDIEKIAKFCIQQANIPAVVMEDLSKKIEYNNAINERLFVLESESELIKEQKPKERELIKEQKPKK